MTTTTKTTVKMVTTILVVLVAISGVAWAQPTSLRKLVVLTLWADDALRLPAGADLRRGQTGRHPSVTVQR